MSKIKTIAVKLKIFSVFVRMPINRKINPIEVYQED